MTEAPHIADSDIRIAYFKETTKKCLSPLEKLCEQKKTTHATTRHALNMSFLLFAFVILHFFLLRSSSCPSTSQTSFLPVLLPAALLFLIIFSPPTSKAVVIVCDARSHRFSSVGRRFFSSRTSLSQAQ